MQNLIPVITMFITKYGKYILLAVGLVLVWRWVKNLFFDNSITTKFNDSGTQLSSSEATHYAERLFSAMKDTGTDEDEIDNVRLLVSRPSDLRSVWNAFGSRPYGTFGSPIFGLGMFATNLDLRGWLKAELSGDGFKVWEQMFLTAGI
ncbi:MAG: hypothetical protein ACK5KV_03000 [Bacteroides graminisolvens]|uniref:hypothetical protein n=1 Tax=Bacteroides graminisolvens TaxID=477666 RepID=UPI003A8A2633